VVAALALSVAGPGALVALGDDGPSRSAPTDRPTRSVLRPTEISAAMPPKQSDKIVILLVSGIGSDAQDGTFDPLIAALDDDPRFEIHRFGADPRHPYDTTGSVTANADQLAAEVRELAKTHPGIEIVAHSMGGVVVDAAFARGLSRDDKVTDYVALASPHAGSTPAIVGQPLLHVADAIGIGTELRAITAGLSQNVGSPAVRDLANVQSASPPRGVARADFRVVTDLVVPSKDTVTPGVTSRSLVPTTFGAIEGHGGVTRDPRAIAVITSTLAHGTPPARTWTDMILESAAAQAWAPIDQLAPAAYGALAVLFFSCAFCLAVNRRVRAIRWLRA
jgi:hypothetical protein